MIPGSRSPESRRRFSQLVHPASGAFILALAAVPLAAQRAAPAQRGGTPRADTPQLVVTVLASNDPRAGIAAADAIRQRIQNEHAATDLYVVPRAKIDQTLSQSGYNPDSALGTSDLMELARQVRGDYALAGTVERTPSGVRTSFRLLTQTGGRIVAEPLPPIDGPDFGDIAKKVDHAVTDALRALGYYHECTNAAQVGDYNKAMAAAQQGLRLRPTSAALNLCVLSILNVTKAAPDSVIAVASTVTSVDSENVVGWASLLAGYDQRGDSARALEAVRVLHRLDPHNVAWIVNFVDRFVASGRPDSASAVLAAALSDMPGDAELLRKRWLLDLRLGHYGEALASGAAFIAADSGAATADYYERQLAAAKGAADSAAMHRLALEASARFPKHADFLLVLARDAMDRGAPSDALGLLSRALSAEPRNPVAWQLSIAARATVNGADSAVATGRQALAAGVSSDAVSTSLLAVVAPLVAKAQTTQSRADWEAVLMASQKVDSVASSANSEFYIGAAAFQIATDDLHSLSEFAGRRAPTRAERQTACASAKELEDMASVVMVAMSKGGSVQPKVASEILRAVPGYSEFASSVKRASCR